MLTEEYYVANKLMKGYLGRRQHRYEFAPVHGIGGGRPQARLRRRRGPGELRRLDAADLVVLVGSIPPGVIPCCCNGCSLRANGGR
jgi:hypothetical protein